MTSIVVFGREPLAGRVKTRLIPELGAAGAAELYAAFLADTLARCMTFDDYDLSLWLAEAPARALDLEVRVEVQRGDDLGGRMAHAIAAELAVHERVIVIGSDSPTLPTSSIDAAVRRLADHDLVLGPSADGGFYLIGARVPIDDVLKDIEWSTPRALEQTLARARDRHVAFMSPWYDVDTPDDLRLLRAHLTVDPTAAPTTAAALARVFELDSRA
jgi:rSAM/selenodomain-associated transferase 1